MDPRDERPSLSGESIHLLLLEDDPDDALLVRDMLGDVRNVRFEVEVRDRLAKAVERLALGGIDLVLLDLSLPDSQGLNTLTAMRSRASETPVVVLTGLEDEAIGLEAVKRGSQDYLVKGRFNAALLGRAIRYAIERMRSEAALRLSKRAAEAASIAKTEFVANISHEIRTPLNSIVGMADLLWETELSVEQREYVRIFRRSGDMLLTLVSDVLDLSKVEAGRLDLEHIDFELFDVLDQVVSVFGLAARDKGIRLLSEIPPDLPWRLRGDPHRLRQILVNLVGNAIKFTAEGHVTLRVENDRQSARPGALLFSIRDTGVGIAAEKLGSVFESFTQADSSVTRQYGGTGLGLAIAKQLVERMGGSLAVESEPGRGSTFRVRLQLEPRPEPVRRPLPPRDVRALRALVVDDSPIERLWSAAPLRDRGITVVELESGAEAIEEAKRAEAGGRPYHLILLDCRMPTMGGFEAARRLRETLGSLERIVMLLPRDHRGDDVARTAALSMAGHLVKPFTSSDLFAAVQAALGAPIEALEPLGPTPRDSERPLRILLAEDSPDNRALIAFYLKASPHRLDTAENGATAVERFSAARYDLVLMDLQMPVLDGYAATREMREWERERGLSATPIVALTAYALREVADECAGAGCSGYLTKPIRKERLLALLRQYGTSLDG